MSIHELLAERGYRVTPQRVAIFDYIDGNTSHPSASDVHEAIKKYYPMVSFATVYKTLEVFVRLGLISEMPFPDGSRYDSNPEAHFNVVCTHCRKIVDVSDDFLPLLAQKAAKLAGFQVKGSRHELYGLCPSCQAGDAHSALPDDSDSQ